jgi:DNA-binding NtrC family response regulator
MPPLRDRREDIPLLIDHFVDMYNQRFKRNISGLTESAFTQMTRYDWPGNIRELQHAIEHSFVLCRQDVLDVCHLPPELNEVQLTAQADCDPGDELARVLAALEKAGWNKSRAARVLGVSRRTIYRKMEELGIREEEDNRE